MNVEQRLVAAMHTTDAVEPSADLWSRVVHSIEEDQAHRRRVVSSAIATIASAAGLALVAVVALIDGPLGRHVRPAVMELLETIALAVLVAVLGPAIRRFGRNYARDLWPATPGTATSLLRLLDVAYLLVFTGFILMTADLSFETSTTLHSQCFAPAVECHSWRGQLEDAGGRIGGLLLVMGVLHAVTLLVLPVIALISNSTRRNRPLPKWLVVVLVIIGGWAGVQLVFALIGLFVGAAGA
jgi:hypothetical protein